MFPDSNRKPASPRQKKIDFPVSFLITRKLFFPPRAISFGFRPMIGAIMPETAINKYCDLGRAENYVGAPTIVWDRTGVNSVSHTRAMEQAADGKLGGRVT